MFFSENACCYCQPLSSTLPVTLLFIHPLAKMLKCRFCGSEGATMHDFHDVQLKERQLCCRVIVSCNERPVDILWPRTLKWVICMQRSMLISISAFLNGHLS